MPSPYSPPSPLSTGTGPARDVPDTLTAAQASVGVDAGTVSMSLSVLRSPAAHALAPRGFALRLWERWGAGDLRPPGRRCRWTAAPSTGRARTPGSRSRRGSRSSRTPSRRARRARRTPPRTVRSQGDLGAPGWTVHLQPGRVQSRPGQVAVFGIGTDNLGAMSGATTDKSGTSAGAAWRPPTPWPVPSRSAVPRTARPCSSLTGRDTVLVPLRAAAPGVRRGSARSSRRRPWPCSATLTSGSTARRCMACARWYGTASSGFRLDLCPHLSPPPPSLRSQRLHAGASRCPPQHGHPARDHAYWLKAPGRVDLVETFAAKRACLGLGQRIRPRRRGPRPGRPLRVRIGSDRAAPWRRISAAPVIGAPLIATTAGARIDGSPSARTDRCTTAGTTAPGIRRQPRGRPTCSTSTSACSSYTADRGPW